MSATLEFHPLSPRRWPDLETLFGGRGACGGCWCMWWRESRAEFARLKGAGNKAALRRLVDAGETPGLLACAGGQPIGWCALAPRERYPRLERSRVLRRVDELPVWSVVCFFVARSWRGKGVSRQLLEAAAEYAGAQGATVVEGYPIEPRAKRMPDVFAYPGLAAAFRAAGFSEVARRSPSRPIFRRLL